jgi:hypothetical protein
VEEVTDGEEDADRWVPPVGDREEGIGYRFGKGLPGPRALFLFWAEGFPEALFIFFLFSSFSFFCFS